MEEHLKRKRSRGLWGLIFTTALGVALALVPNSGANKEPASFQGMLHFPRNDSSDEQIQIPLHTALAQLSVDSEDGSGSHNATAPPVPEITFPLMKEMVGQIEATLVYRPDIGGGYLLLAPAGWQAEAVVGVNGSYGVTFQDPNNPAQNLHYSDNAWGCVGCAISGIGTYFPGKEEWADEMGFTVYEPLKFIERHILGEVGVELRTVRYTLLANSNGYQVYGSANYDQGEWGYLFRKIEITLSVESPEQKLVETIIDFFIKNQGPFIIPNTKGGEMDKTVSTIDPSFYKT